jgi:hypothetical protein
VVGSAQVHPAALAECAWIVHQVLAHRPEIARALGEAGVRFAVMAATEYTTDLPEHAHLTPRVYWDRRARGLGASPEAPAVSCGEENLLAIPGDPYPTENIGIHEFAHAIHIMAMPRVDPTFEERLKRAYAAAKTAGLWRGTYAIVDHEEYWAEATQDWFDDNRENDSLHNHVNTRVELQAYDPAAAALCAEVYGDLPWRYLRPNKRAAADRAHLAAHPAPRPARFDWRREPVPAAPRLRIDCAAGTIELELQTAAHEAATTRFLEHVQLGYYSDGRLRRDGDGFRFEPSTKMPTGDPVPRGEGFWSLRATPAAAGELAGRFLSGTEFLPDASAPAGLVLQRAVRLN